MHSGERVIAKELGVSYMTARKAVESLVTKGVLYKVPKKGTAGAQGQLLVQEISDMGLLPFLQEFKRAS